VYSCSREIDGDAIDGCFQHTPGPTGPVLAAKGPYRANDNNRALHQRLAIHNRHFIPIGFYYSKWLEKLRFHLDNRDEERRSSSSSSDSSRSSQRSQASKADNRAKTRLQPSPKRPKINDDRNTPSGKSPTPEQHMRDKDFMSHADRMRKRQADREADKITSSSAAAPRVLTHKELLLKRATILDDRADTKLGIQDKAVFQYREERRLQYYLHGHGMDEDEGAFNAQYDAEQFTAVQELLERGDNNNDHGSAEQESR
jgi:hypothetical protein